MRFFTHRLLAILAIGVLAILHVDTASAIGKPRYIKEGNVKIRFYYDQSFYANQFFQYNDLQTDLMNSLGTVGTYALGINFTPDTSNVNFLVNMGSQQLWSRDQIKAWMDKNLKIEANVIKVLIHFRGMSQRGDCLESDPTNNSFQRDEGITWRDPPSGGKASAHVVITAKFSCDPNNSGRKSQSDLRLTFVHEIGHALGHNGAVIAQPNLCTTAPTASIMCHTWKAGLKRNDYQKWFAQDIAWIRDDVFDGTKPNARVACYEFASYAHCDNECINGAGFPRPDATAIYENCRRTYCDTMCR
jgi:hypothetical protein